MIKKALDMLEKVIMVTLGILTALMVAVIFYQVVLRYALASANPWADEVARYAMIWVVMLASPVGFRRYRHIRIDILVRNVPQKVRKVIDLFVYIVELVFLFVLFFAGTEICGKVSGQMSMALGIPNVFVYSSVYIGVGISIIFIFENIYNEYIAALIHKQNRKEVTP